VSLIELMGLGFFCHPYLKESIEYRNEKRYNKLIIHKCMTPEKVGSVKLCRYIIQPSVYFDNYAMETILITTSFFFFLIIY
jgi:hypothetical protein